MLVVEVVVEDMELEQELVDLVMTVTMHQTTPQEKEEMVDLVEVEEEEVVVWVERHKELILEVVEEEDILVGKVV